MAPLVQVGAPDQREKGGVAQIVGPGEGDEGRERGLGVHRVEVELRLGGADIAIGVLEHRPEEIVLVLEIVVDHPLVGLGASRDGIDPRAGEAKPGELGPGGHEDARLGGVGIAAAGRLAGSGAARRRRR